MASSASQSTNLSNTTPTSARATPIPRTTSESRPNRDYAADGPSFTQTVRTMASGESNPWDEFTFQNATLSEAFPCNGGILPLRKEEIYKSGPSVRKYVENCIIDIGTRTQGTFRSDHYFGGALLLDVHDSMNDIRRDVWFDGKTVQFQHPLTVMSIRASGVIHTYGVSRGMQASIGGQSIDLLRCIRGPSDNTKRSECTVDIASTTTKLVITPAGTGSITVDVNGTDAGGDVSGSLASGLTLTLPQSEDGDIITIDMPSVTVGDERYVFKIRTRPPPDADAPAQVTGLASTDVTDDSITVSWTAIADVDRYVVEHSTDSTFATKSTTNVRKQGSNPPATSVTLDGLTATTTYYTRVYAVNSDGNGLRSTPLTIATSDVPPPPVAPPAPAAPTDLDINTPLQANDLHNDDRKSDENREARRASMKQLKADWEEVVIPSGTVTYKVQWRTDSQEFDDERSHTTSEPEYEIMGLRRNTLYYIQVSAIATDNGLSTTGPADAETGRTRRAAYDCANVDGSIAITGSVPTKIDLVAGHDTTLTMPSYARPGLPLGHLRGQPGPKKGGLHQRSRAGKQQTRTPPERRTGHPATYGERLVRRRRPDPDPAAQDNLSLAGLSGHADVRRMVRHGLGRLHGPRRRSARPQSAQAHHRRQLRRLQGLQ